jgi:hypothetical protein
MMKYFNINKYVVNSRADDYIKNITSSDIILYPYRMLIFETNYIQFRSYDIYISLNTL